jgi:hypothetical protein
VRKLTRVCWCAGLAEKARSTDRYQFVAKSC